MSTKSTLTLVLSLLAVLGVAGCPSTVLNDLTEARNIAVVEASYEKLWNQDDETQFDDLVQIPGYVHHENDKPDVVFTSYEQLDAGFDAAQLTTPDVHYTINRIFAKGDEVIVQWTALGTFQGDYGPIEATGEQISFTGITIYRLENGKIVESWTEDDDQDALEAFLNEDLDNSGDIAGDVP
jgi:predicted ester cyclase